MNATGEQDVTMSYLIEQHLQELLHPAEGEPYSAATIRSRKQCLYQLNDGLPHGWAYACTEQLRAWLAGPPEPTRRWSPATRYAYTGHVVAGYQWLQAAGYRQDDPTIGFRRPTVPVKPVRIATEQQFIVALTAPEPLLTAVVLAAYGGLRRSEAADSWREHITEDRILIPRAKGGKQQTVPTHPAIWDHIRNRPAGPLIVDEHGVQYTPERLSGLAGRWFGRHIAPGFGLHHFRRRLGVLVQREYRDIRVTQRLLRHATLAAIERYTDATDEQMREALQVLRRPEPGPSRLGQTPAA